MIEQREWETLETALPLLSLLTPDMVKQFMREATVVRIPAEQDVMAEGERVEAVPLLLSGSIRVYKIGQTGREITIYRFGGGECCVLSADSILGNRFFPANAQVEEDAVAAFIPASVFNAWLANSSAFRAFVFDSMARRLTSLLDTIDDVAFRRMDARVALLLLARSAGRRATVAITHQAIADELGSSREVISRVLEDMEGRGQIRLSRGAVEVLDPDRLERTSAL